jgi:hypothetical protein
MAEQSVSPQQHNADLDAFLAMTQHAVEAEQTPAQAPGEQAPAEVPAGVVASSEPAEVAAAGDDPDREWVFGPAHIEALPVAGTAPAGHTVIEGSAVRTDLNPVTPVWIPVAENVPAATVPKVNDDPLNDGKHWEPISSEAVLNQAVNPGTEPYRAKPQASTPDNVDWFYDKATEVPAPVEPEVWDDAAAQAAYEARMAEAADERARTNRQPLDTVDDEWDTAEVAPVDPASEGAVVEQLAVLEPRTPIKTLRAKAKRMLVYGPASLGAWITIKSAGLNERSGETFDRLPPRLAKWMRVADLGAIATTAGLAASIALKIANPVLAAKGYSMHGLEHMFGGGSGGGNANVDLPHGVSGHGGAPTTYDAASYTTPHTEQPVTHVDAHNVVHTAPHENFSDNVRTAHSEDAASGRASNVYDWSKQSLVQQLHDAGVPKDEIAKMTHDPATMHRLREAFYADNPSVAHDSHHYLNANATYHTGKMDELASKLADSRAHDLGIDTGADAGGTTDNGGHDGQPDPNKGDTGNNNTGVDPTNHGGHPGNEASTGTGPVVIDIPPTVVETAPGANERLITPRDEHLMLGAAAVDSLLLAVGAGTGVRLGIEAKAAGVEAKPRKRKNSKATKAPKTPKPPKAPQIPEVRPWHNRGSRPRS